MKARSHSTAQSTPKIHLQPHVQIFPNAEELAKKSAQFIVETIQRCLSQQTRFSLALAGGSTPKKTYQTLAQREFQNQIPWDKVHLFWGDERLVPPDHPDSNYHMVKEALLDHILIPDENVHRIRTELENPKEIAENYEHELQHFFDPNQKGHSIRFDLVLLGLGENGHIASLFPDSNWTPDTSEAVLALWIPELNAFRISLSCRTLNSSKNIYFIVSGSKREILNRVLNTPIHGKGLPAQLIHPKDGKLLWLIDQEAAKENLG